MNRISHFLFNALNIQGKPPTESRMQLVYTLDDRLIVTIL